MSAADYGKLTVHPYAAMFPLVEGAEFDALVGSIKEHGLQVKILVDSTRSILVDGRNRYRALRAAGISDDEIYQNYTVTMSAGTTEPHILDKIVTLNVHRRTLTDGQRVALAADYKLRRADWERSEAHRRRKQMLRQGAESGTHSRGGDFATTGTEATGKLRDEIGDKFAVRGRAVDEYIALEAKHPELAAEVAKGNKKLGTACREVAARGDAGKQAKLEASRAAAEEKRAELAAIAPDLIRAAIDAADPDCEWHVRERGWGRIVPTTLHQALTAWEAPEDLACGGGPETDAWHELLGDLLAAWLPLGCPDLADRLDAVHDVIDAGDRFASVELREAAIVRRLAVTAI